MVKFRVEWPAASLKKPKGSEVVRLQMGTVGIIISLITELVPQFKSRCASLLHLYAISKTLI